MNHFWKKIFSQKRKDTQTIDESLDKNVKKMQSFFHHTPDFIVKTLTLADGKKAALFFIDNLVDQKMIDNNLLQPLIYKIRSSRQLMTGEIALPIGRMQRISKWGSLEKAIFNGMSVLLIDGYVEGLSFDTQGWPQRALTEPEHEATIGGGHQGFVETASINIALIRRYVQNRQLQIKEYKVGSRSLTRLYMIYIDDIANKQIVHEVEDRIQQIHVDSIVNSGELIEYIEDHSNSIFPQILMTERPDTAASHLFQGRIALIMDHAPSALILPVTFTSFFQIVDDYNSRWIVASFIRILRFIAFLAAISLPALYIAIISFNYELLPLDLLLSIAESRSKVPFPPIMEGLLMEIAVEMLREAGLRLPGPIGQTVGVVGGIVIGEAAVQAGIVSNVMVVIVSITAVSSYIIPNYEIASSIRLVRFPMMFLAALFGMVGLAIGMMVLFIHLVTIESFGIPYGSPIAPTILSDWKDTFVRLPLWKMNQRPQISNPNQTRRQAQSRRNDDL